MTKKIISAALFAIISVAFTSCQKENLTEPTTLSVESNTYYTIRYIVNGKVHYYTIHNEEDWDTLMSMIIDLAHQGYTISIADDKMPSRENYNKETIVYTTTNEVDAQNWTKKKITEGYIVTTTYNPKTGEYTCTAFRN